MSIDERTVRVLAEQAETSLKGLDIEADLSGAKSRGRHQRQRRRVARASAVVAIVVVALLAIVMFRPTRSSVSVSSGPQSTAGDLIDRNEGAVDASLSVDHTVTCTPDGRYVITVSITNTDSKPADLTGTK